ncbi:MAG TPA: single-stranded-DNA-specific exonuclease RecJ [Clostridiales bacterium]|nr:single-stranded-DNA-specific exonuclease RecJ [Clostridiales bacterium]
MGLKKWQVAKIDKQSANMLAKELDIDPLVALIAYSRGYTDPYELEEFLSDEIIIEDPFVIADMQIAANRINSAIEKKERIAVYGDYDCDGVTATALLYGYLQKRGADVVFYIPDREGEGFGMNINSVDYLKSKGVSLIITVDNGINAVEAVDHANSIGIDVVITDHHLPTGQLPNAVAVVDPHRLDCNSSFKDLAGVGVAFKLVCALENLPPEELIHKYADLLAIGTVADIMPIVSENRVIVREGLKILKNPKRTGINALFEACGLNGKELNTGKVSFIIAPRINTAGRMSDAQRVVNMLLEDDYGKALEIANQLCEENARRQMLEQKIVVEACQQIEQKGYEFDRVIVVAGEGWHQGIVGIAASKLVERYGKPCIIFSVSGDTATGSGRSIDGFHLLDAIKSCSHMLLRFGGHSLAAGLTIKTEDIERFRHDINQYAAGCDMPVPVLKLDCKINPAALSVELADVLSALEPFGHCNPTPLFGLFNMKIEKIAPVGSGHLRLTLSRNEAVINAVMFSATPEQFPFEQGDIVDLAVSLSVNLYNGKRYLSVQIKALRPSGIDQDRLFDEVRLYDAYRRGEINQREAAVLRPGREDLALVFRCIRANKHKQLNIISLLYKLFDRIGFGKLRICVDVLLEMGIIQINGNYFQLSLLNSGEKINLSDSKILSYLDTVSNGVESWAI